MATEQQHKLSNNLWISTHYRNDQVTIEVRKSTNTRPMCCITSGTDRIHLTFLHGSTCLYWKECLITPEQYTYLDDSENIMFTVRAREGQKTFSLSQNGDLLVVITAKNTGEFFLSFLTNTTIVLPKTSMEAVIDTFSSATNPDYVMQEPDDLSAQNNDQTLADDSVNIQTDLILSSKGFNLPNFNLDTFDFVC